ncbi:MAG: hypothetical protein Q8K61_08780 [Gallionella sp.]|nr:hypothetical protein [Gallionella sp.]
MSNPQSTSPLTTIAIRAAIFIVFAYGAAFAADNFLLPIAPAMLTDKAAALHDYSLQNLQKTAATAEVKVYK